MSNRIQRCFNCLTSKSPNIITVSGDSSKDSSRSPTGGTLLKSQKGTPKGEVKGPGTMIGRIKNTSKRKRIKKTKHAKKTKKPKKTKRRRKRKQTKKR